MPSSISQLAAKHGLPIRVRDVENNDVYVFTQLIPNTDIMIGYHEDCHYAVTSDCFPDTDFDLVKVDLTVSVLVQTLKEDYRENTATPILCLTFASQADADFYCKKHDYKIIRRVKLEDYHD